MIRDRAQIYAILLFILFTVFGLAYAWEHGFEEVVCRALGLPFDEEFEAEEKWRFIATSTAFSALALVGPASLITAIFSRLQGSLRKEAEARRLAQAANEAKSAFLANMSHELRTPLNGVLGFSSALASTPLAPNQAEMVGLIESTAKRLDDLLGDILDLSRIEAGRLEITPQRVDIERLVADTVALFEAPASAKGLLLISQVTGNGARECLADPVRVQQVLTNLISNALKFTAKGQVRVQVSLERVADKTAATFVVADTGVGFDPAQTERLFGRFEQADNSNTRAFGGSGLGLAISRSLVEAMGGELNATSQPGLGSTFTVELELEAAEPAPVPAPTPGPAQVNAGARVLLAEDDVVNRRAVEVILGLMGLSVHCVDNGAEAVMAAQTSHYDLILMDIRMPTMDGLTAVRAIRALELRTRDAPTTIYALSAQAITGEFEAAFAAGVDDYLTKPIAASALQAAVAKALAGRPAPRREVLAG